MNARSEVLGKAHAATKHTCFRPRLPAPFHFAPSLSAKTPLFSTRRQPMKSSVLSALLIGLVFVSTAAGEDRPLPGAWRLNSHAAANYYRIGLDREIRHGGKSAAILESRADWKEDHY